MKGYEDEPYLRFLPNRVVEENLRSPSKYANEDRYALTPLPPQANSDATPKWKPVSRDGSYRWFDHRIHSMEKGTPPQVKDEGVRTKIFDWRVPMTVGGAPVRRGRHARVGAGGLVRQRRPALLVALAAAGVLLLAALAFLLGAARARAPPPASPAAPAHETADEAW